MENDKKEPCGVLLLDKPAGVTSHDMVGFVRRMYDTRQVGHAGTLDPMATGVLPIMVGRATKLSPFLSDHDKTYEATLRLGITTDTGDITGKVLTESRNIPSDEAVSEVCRSFVGTIMQTPPMYSAIKKDGHKLVDLARKGIDIEREPREIQIYSLRSVPTDSPSDYKLTIHCGKGTYIRTLCEDIGKALGCGGTMASLRRMQVEHFSIDRCVTKEALETMSKEQKYDLLLKPEDCFPSFPKLKMPSFYNKLCRNGCSIDQAKIKTDFPVGEKVFLLDSISGQVYALSEIVPGETGTAIKTICLLTL